MSKFPWDEIKANTLRVLCREIGMPTVYTRQDMISLFRIAEEQGRECTIPVSTP